MRPPRRGTDLASREARDHLTAASGARRPGELTTGTSNATRSVTGRQERPIGMKGARVHDQITAERPAVETPTEAPPKEAQPIEAAPPEAQRAARQHHPAAGRSLTIVNRRGLHARASAKFVRVADAFDAEITVSKGGQSVGGTSIMGLMLLAASPGCCIEVSAKGPQAREALDAIEKLVAEGFGEEC